MAEPENGNANRLSGGRRPNENEQNIILQTQRNKAIRTLNTILIAIFQVVCQGGICSAIKTHPTTVKSYIVAIVIYAFAWVCYISRILPDRYLPILRATASLMGTLATTLLLMVILPVFGWIVFAVWVLLCVSLAWRFRIGLAIEYFSTFSPPNYMLPVQL